jgi:hypothetical protein
VRSLKRFLLNASMASPQGEQRKAHNNEENCTQKKAEKDRKFANVRGI